jgi:N6-L-threonylcarbamoyladenine synthase
MPVHAQAPDSFPTDLARLLPHLGLIVSGGNTILFSISEAKVLTKVSATRDDAAGEALDKGAKLLGIGYPGGPAIEKLARGGRADAFDFPRGMGRQAGLDMSFSGLKTSLRYRVQAMKEEEVRTSLADLCASYQTAVIDALSGRTGEALAQGAYKSVGLSGGVANNLGLRAAIQEKARGAGATFLAADPRHTGDNAAMIGFAAWIDAADARRFSGSTLRVDPGAYL